MRAVYHKATCWRDEQSFPAKMLPSSVVQVTNDTSAAKLTAAMTVAWMKKTEQEMG
jgi:hypothetical protein